MTGNGSPGITILLVDDEEILRDLSQVYLEQKCGIHVDTADSANQAIAMMKKNRYDVIVSDYEMPEKNGIDLLREVRMVSSDLPFILFTGKGREEIAVEAFNCGVTFYLQKGGEPVAQFTELTHKITLSVDQLRMRRRMSHLYRIFQALLRISDAIHEENSIGDILQEICTIITREHGYRSIRIILFDETGKITAAHEDGMGERFSAFIAFLKSGNRTTCTKQALLNERTPLIRKPDASCQNCPLYPDHLGQFSMTARLEHAGEVYGILSVTTDSDITHDPDEEAMFRDLTRSVAYAIHHHALRDEKNAVQSLVAMNKKLHIINSITRHDIRNQMTAISSSLDLLRLRSDLPSDVYEIMNLMEGAAGNILEHLIFSEIYHSIGLQQPRWLGMSGIIGAIRGAHVISTVTLIDATSSLEIYTDPMFGKIILNLIDNAIMHGRNVTNITVDFIEGADRGILMITDDGMGVPIDEKERIFKKGVGKNSGMGLYLTREILSITGMTIRETGIYGDGARFEICIPKNGYRLAGKAKRIPSGQVRAE